MVLDLRAWIVWTDSSRDDDPNCWGGPEDSPTQLGGIQCQTVTKSRRDNVDGCVWMSSSSPPLCTKRLTMSSSDGGMGGPIGVARRSRF